MKTEQEQIEKIMCMFNKLRRGANHCTHCDFCNRLCSDVSIDCDNYKTTG